MGVMTQYESAIIRQPLTDISFLEANVWGMVFYAAKLNEEEHPSNLIGVHLYEFVGHLLVFLRHAIDLFRLTGLVGLILIEASLQSIRDRKWIYAHQPIPGTLIGTTRPPSGLDDELALSVPTTVENLRENPNGVAMDILRSIFFSLDWGDIVDSQAKLETLIQQGHHFNRG